MDQARRNFGSYQFAAAFAVCTLILAGCASTPPAPVEDLSLGGNVKHDADRAAPREPVATDSYRVLSGDTLYAIAFKHGLDYRDLAAWNHIVPPFRIYAGQELRLSMPAPSSMHATPVPAQVATTQPSARSNAVPVDTSSAAPQNPHVDNAATPSQASPVGFQPVEDAVQPQAPSDVAQAESPRSPSAASASRTTQVETRPKAAPAAVESPPVAAPKSNDSVAELNAGGVNWRWPGDGKIVATYVSGDQTKQGIDIAGNAGDPVLAAADGDVVYSGNGLLGYGELIIIKHNANFLSAYGHNRKRLVQESDHVKAGQRIAEMGSSASSRDELHFEIRKNGKPVNPLDYLPVR